MAEHDLTPILGQYLDPHLLIPSLEFLSDKKIYDETDMLKSKLHLISKTNMIDYAIDIHKIIYPDQDEPAELTQKKTNVFKRLERLEKANLPFLNMFSDPEVHEKLEKSRDPRDLIDSLKEHGFKNEMLDHLYEYAKFQYECGKYDKALEYLSILRLFTPQTDKHYLPLFWGMLACHILMSNWDAALEEFNRLKDHIDSSLTSSLMTLQQRTWLIHWGLLIYFNHPLGRDHLVEMFLETNFAKKQNSKQMYYTHALQTLCPHILRYLSVAVIVSKQRRQYMKDLVRIIQSESHAYRDSITEFVECLCVNFDFDAAQGKLRECEEVLNNDFFLVTSLSDFIENARLFIFETFCQIHECISITKLSEKLNMSEQEAERWIVDLIRNARLDAKIDSKHGHVVMGTQAVSPYQQLIEKTKAMYMRSQVLTMNLNRRSTVDPEKTRNDF
uniref:Eukaryotic translation initiation factor 3 subunit E n=1 Tax=Aceria tosichella TaxID=561515 RepID=A0A6G1SC92_9ACAR